VAKGKMYILTLSYILIRERGSLIAITYPQIFNSFNIKRQSMPPSPQYRQFGGAALVRSKNWDGRGTAFRPKKRPAFMPTF